MANPVMKILTFKFDQEQDSDLTFVVENRRIYAHRHYLALVSTHLSTMLSERWTDLKQREVTITDYDYSTFYNYIRFLYTGVIAIDMENLESLYSLSHCYLEDSLQEQCENFIISQLGKSHMNKWYQFVVKFGSKSIHERIKQWVSKTSVESTNYTNLLALAHTYKMEQEKKKIELFIQSELEDLLNYIWITETNPVRMDCTFQEIYILILKYKLDSLEIQLEHEIYNRYPSDSSKHQKRSISSRPYASFKTIPMAHSDTLSTIIRPMGVPSIQKPIFRNSSEIFRSNYANEQSQEENWKRLKQYYKIALKFKSSKLQQCFETLLKEDFHQNPFKVYKQIVDFDQGSYLRNMIEQEIPKTSQGLEDIDKLINEILKPASENGRLGQNPELKLYLEERLINHTFNKADLFLNGKFKTMLLIAYNEKMLNLVQHVTNLFNKFMFDDIFDGIDRETAVNYIHSMID